MLRHAGCRGRPRAFGEPSADRRSPPNGNTCRPRIRLSGSAAADSAIPPATSSGRHWRVVASRSEPAASACAGPRATARCPQARPYLSSGRRRRDAGDAGEHGQPVALGAGLAFPDHVRLGGKRELGDQAQFDRRVRPRTHSLRPATHARRPRGCRGFLGVPGDARPRRSRDAPAGPTRGSPSSSSTRPPGPSPTPRPPARRPPRPRRRERRAGDRARRARRLPGPAMCGTGSCPAARTRCAAATRSSQVGAGKGRHVDVRGRRQQAVQLRQLRGCLRGHLDAGRGGEAAQSVRGSGHAGCSARRFSIRSLARRTAVEASAA